MKIKGEKSNELKAWKSVLVILPNEILRSDSRSLDCGTDQATTGYVNSPTSVAEANSNVRITETENRKRRERKYI